MRDGVGCLTVAETISANWREPGSQFRGNITLRWSFADQLPLATRIGYLTGVTFISRVSSHVHH